MQQKYYLQAFGNHLLGMFVVLFTEEALEIAGLVALPHNQVEPPLSVPIAKVLPLARP